MSQTTTPPVPTVHPVSARRSWGSFTSVFAEFQIGWNNRFIAGTAAQSVGCIEPDQVMIDCRQAGDAPPLPLSRAAALCDATDGGLALDLGQPFQITDAVSAGAICGVMDDTTWPEDLGTYESLPEVVQRNFVASSEVSLAKAFYYGFVNDPEVAPANQELLTNSLPRSGPNGDPVTYAGPSLPHTGALEFRAALAAVDAELTMSLNGFQGYIHMSPLALQAAHELLHFVDGRYYTANQNTVVADPAYDGTVFPDGEALTAGQEWLFGTGPVAWSLSPVRDTGVFLMTNDEDHNRASPADPPGLGMRNQLLYRVIREGLTSFDNCSHVAVEAILPCDWTGV